MCYNEIMQKIETVTDAATWDRMLLSLPNPHILQSWMWGILKERQNWQASRFLWRDKENGYPLAAAQLLTQQRGHLRLGYIPKGPILDWNDISLVAQVLSDLEAHAQSQKLLLLKLDPDVQANTRQGETVVTLLKRHNWHASFEQIQFRNTMILNLEPNLSTLMAQMKSKWRYNIRLAVRRGVIVREARDQELPMLYEMYEETAKRDNFVIREPAYYLDVWRRFRDAGLALHLVAEADQTPLAMAILLHFGPCMWYMYGASYSRHRNLMPNHLLQWEAMRRAKALGCTTYDLWGAPNYLHKSDPMWGVYRFKLGFGANFVAHIGAFDFAPQRWLYNIYAFLRPRVVALAHRRYWIQIGNEQINR